MKLYTEEQLRKILEELQKALLPENVECEGAYCMGCWKDIVRGTTQIINSLTPIELPSEEDKEKYIKSFPYTKHLDDGQYNDGVLVGVELGIEWVIDKIKNQQQ